MKIVKKAAKHRETVRSRAEKAFQEAWEKHGLKGSDLEREYVWHPHRLFRFDFAFPSQKLAVELDSKQYHGSYRGMVNDREKCNLAVEYGWSILHYPSWEIANVLEWVEQVRCVLCGIPSDADDYGEEA